MLIKFRCSIVLLALTLISGCSTLSDRGDWPDGVREQNYFLNAWQTDTTNQQYQSEQDYLLWVRRFYQGFNIVPGWLDMTEQLLVQLEQPQRSNVEAQLVTLGGRIGSEWAKDNNARLLNTRSAAVWRDALIESLEQDDLQNYLDRLRQDITDIMSGVLVNDDIYFERYYVDEFDF